MRGGVLWRKNKLTKTANENQKGVDSCKEGQRIATPQQAISCSFIRLEHRSQVLQIQLMASADHLEEDK